VYSDCGNKLVFALGLFVVKPQVSPPVQSIGLLGGLEMATRCTQPLSGQAPGSKWFPGPKPKASDDTLGTLNMGTNPLGVAFDGANIWVANAVANGTVSKM
jgi:DNA-binding beta-propeller fold protein YncE